MLSINNLLLNIKIHWRRLAIALVLILVLVFLLFFSWKWFREKTAPVAAAYQMELPEGMSQNELNQLTDGQKRLLDEMIARNLQAKVPKIQGMARPAVVILTQNNQPILPGLSPTPNQGVGGQPSRSTLPSSTTSPTAPPTSPAPPISPTPSASPLLSPSPSSIPCTDSDNGKDYFTKGTTTGYYIDDNYLSLTDICRSINPDGSNPDWVLEYHCETAGSTPQGRTPYISTSSFHCPNGCQDGTCKGTPASPSPLPACTDSDGGLDYFTKGVVNQTGDPLSPHKDYCTEVDGISWDKPYLIEYTCENNHWKMNTYDCPNGCQDGVCKSGPPPSASPFNFLSVSGANFLVSNIDNGQGNWQIAQSTCAGLGVRLPAMAELNILYPQKNNFGFKDASYWSSQENGDQAYYVHFSNGFNNSMDKDFTFPYFRCVKDGASPLPSPSAQGMPPATRGAPSFSFEDEAGNYYQDKNKHHIFSDIIKIYQEVEGKFGQATKLKNLKIRLSTVPTANINYFNATTVELILSPQNPPSREELSGLLVASLYDEQIFLKPKVFAEEVKKIDIGQVFREVFKSSPEPESKAPKKETASPSPLPTVTTTCATDWQEEIYKKFGFKFKIPPGWTDTSIDEWQSETLVYRSLVSTTRPEEQMDPKYKLSQFEILVSASDLKTHEDYSRWFDNNTDNQKKSIVDFKDIKAEKYVDETEMACSSQTEQNPVNCSHRFEMYYFKKGNFYYLLSIGLYTDSVLKEKNEAVLKCFLDSFELIGESSIAQDNLKPCTPEIYNLKTGCNNVPKKPVCGSTKMVFDNAESRVDKEIYENACRYCSQFDPGTGFSELRGTKFYMMGFKEGACD